MVVIVVSMIMVVVVVIVALVVVAIIRVVMVVALVVVAIILVVMVVPFVTVGIAMVVTFIITNGIAVMVGVVMRHHPGGCPADPQAQQQSHRQGQSIMLVELEFREQITQRDAEDHARGEGDRRRLDRRPPADAGPPDDGTDGDHQCVGDVEPVPHRAGSSVGGEQRAQREGIERLVECDRDQQPGTGGTKPVIDAGHRGSEGEPRKQRVNAQADERPEPRRCVGMRAALVLTRHGVMMEADEPLEQEHGEKAADHPGGQRRHLVVQMHAVADADRNRIGKQVEHRDCDHDAGDEAQRNLHAPVREPDEKGQQAPDQGSREEHDKRENEGGRHPGRISGGVLSLLPILLLCLLAAALPWGRGRLPILMYHKVRPGPADPLTVPSDVFRSQMGTLVRAGYESISFADLAAFHRGERPLPPRPVLLTFDDAYADYEAHAAAAMREHGLDGTVFLPVGCIGGENTWDGGGEPLMNWEDVRRVAADGTEFAIHSFAHDNYRDLSLEEMRVDLARCIAELDARRIPYQKVLAYPYGGFPRDEPLRSRMRELFDELGIEYAARLGYRVERTKPRDRHALRRIGIDASDRGFRFLLKRTLGRTRL